MSHLQNVPGRFRSCGKWHPDTAVEHNRANCWLVSLPPWVPFGTHASDDVCAYKGPLEMKGEGEDGLPLWERHEGCPSERDTRSAPVVAGSEGVCTEGGPASDEHGALNGGSTDSAIKGTSGNAPQE